MARVLVFDTETTGLFPNTIMSLDRQPEIFEWFSLVLDTETLEMGEELHLFFKPSKPLEAGASKATGKKDEDLKDFPKFVTGATEIKSMIESCDFVAAHNLQYDVTVTDFEFARIESFVNWPVKHDTILFSEWYFGHRPTLTMLYNEFFEEDFGNKHAADADVRALARCYVEMIKRSWI